MNVEIPEIRRAPGDVILDSRYDPNSVTNKFNLVEVCRCCKTDTVLLEKDFPSL